MKMLQRRLVDWIEHRTGLESAAKNFLFEEIPASSGWHQVFEQRGVFLVLVQAFTGLLWIEAQIRSPKRHLAETMMPAYKLNPDEMDALVVYLTSIPAI